MAAEQNPRHEVEARYRVSEPGAAAATLADRQGTCRSNSKQDGQAYNPASWSYVRDVEDRRTFRVSDPQMKAPVCGDEAGQQQDGLSGAQLRDAREFLAMNTYNRMEHPR
jgi:hypothetical protein